HHAPSSWPVAKASGRAQRLLRALSAPSPWVRQWPAPILAYTPDNDSSCALPAPSIPATFPCAACSWSGGRQYQTRRSHTPQIRGYVASLACIEDMSSVITCLCL